MRFAVFLRGVNVGGGNRVKMADLKQSLESCGFKDVKTYLNSGNVVLESDKTGDNIRDKVKEIVEEEFGLDIQIIVKSQAQMDAILKADPFKKQKDQYFIMLSGHKTDALEKLLKEQIAKMDTADEYVWIDDCIHLFCTNGYGKTQLNNIFFEKKLKLHATARNWNTMTKVRALM